MARQRLLKALNREYPDKMPHYLIMNHPTFISDVTGIDYFQRPLDACLKFHQIYEVEIGGQVALSNKPIKKETLKTKWHLKSPFKTVEEILEFDVDPFGKDSKKALYPDYALCHYQWLFKENWDGQIEKSVAEWEKREKLYPGKFTPGDGFYTTAFMWPIMIFGWELFLEAGGLYSEETGRLIKRFSKITRKFFQYASQSNSRFVTAHDDIAGSTGPIFHPDWYRKYIFPIYEEMYEPVRKAGKPIIFLSDGNLVPFLDDIKRLNPDGIIFEPSTDLNVVIEKLGKNKIIVGNIDSRILQSGTKDDIFNEVKRVADVAREIPGFMLSCTNGIQQTVPIQNVYHYFAAIEKFRVR